MHLDCGGIYLDRVLQAAPSLGLGREDLEPRYRLSTEANSSCVTPEHAKKHSVVDRMLSAVSNA